MAFFLLSPRNTVSGNAADRYYLLRRPRDRHAGTRAAAAPRPRRQERDGAMNGSRARRHPRRTGAGAGDAESAGRGERALTVTRDRGECVPLGVSARR